MGINLLEFVKAQLTPALVTKIAGLIGEKNNETQKAISVLLPSVLGGLANKATTLTNADNLLDMVNEGGHDGRIFDTLSTLLAGGITTQGILRIGNDVVNTLFSTKTKSISDWVAYYASIKTGSATNLMNLVAPLLMGAIGKQLDGKGTASTMIALLGSQLPHLKNGAIPSELLGLLGLSNLSLAPPPPKQETPPVVVVPPTLPAAPVVVPPVKPFNKLFNKSTPKPQNPPVIPNKPVITEKTKPIIQEKPQNKPLTPEKSEIKPVVIDKEQAKSEKTLEKQASNADEKPLIHQLKPWLLLLGAALFGLVCLRMCKSEQINADGTPVVAEVPKTDSLTTDIVGSEKTLKLTDSEIKVKAGSFLDGLYTIVATEQGDTSKILIFDNVNFAKNKTELTDSSKTQLSDLVKIMKAFPKFDIKINGYTDSRGDADENKKLSSGRAAAVKSYLTARDINADRIKTEGFGAANPITSNETEEGRAKNRRIEARVTKK